MAIAVASTATASGNASSSIVVTAPTGIQVGDLLIICAGGGGSIGGTVYPTSTGFTASIEHLYDPGGALSAGHIALLYKIAVSADTTAPNYTVAMSDAELGGVAMLRVTGWSTGNPVFHSAESNAYQDGNLTVNDTVAFARASQQLLIQFGCTLSTGGDAGTFSFGTYQVTSSDSNPTWTEVVDVAFNTNGGTVNGKFFCAYATSSNTSTITSYGFTKTGDSADSEETTTYAIGVIYTPVNPTVDVSHLAITPSISGITASQVNIGADISHLAVTPTINGVTASVSSDGTQWTNEPAVSTTWTNEPI